MLEENESCFTNSNLDNEEDIILNSPKSTSK